MEELATIYIEDVDGIYSAYKSKNDPYASGSKLIAANLDKSFADALCEATSKYNQSQDALYQLFTA